MRLKEWSVELRDRVVSRHRSGEGYQKNSAALKVHKNTVAILKMEELALPRAGCPAKLINREKRALVREVTKNLTSGRNLAPLSTWPIPSLW